MNIKLIAEVSTLGFMCALKTVNFLAERKFEKLRAMELAVAENSSEELAKYMAAKESLDLRDSVLAREKKAFQEACKDYKKRTRFDASKAELYSEVDVSLKNFRDSIGYQERMAEIQKDMEDSIAAFKASVNYDSSIEVLDKEIEAANKKWEAQEKLFASTDDDISDTALKLKHAAEDAKNDTIRKAKEQKDILEQQLNREKATYEAKRKAAVREMEEKVAKEKRRLSDLAEKRVNELERKYDEFKEQALTDIQATRTEAESDCILMANDNEELVAVQDSNDYSRALEITADTPAAERLGWWLKEHHWNKTSVAIVGALPVIPTGYLAYRYGKFVLDVMKMV